MSGLLGDVGINISHTALVPLAQRQDVPRAEARIRVRARFGVPHSAAVVVVSGHVLRRADAGPDGSVEFVAYESEWPSIQSWVEDRVAELAAAERAHETKVARVAASVDRVPIDAARDPSSWSDDARRQVARYTGSVEAEFFAITGRGIRPFLSAEIVERLPPPTEQRANEIAAVIRDAVLAERDRVGGDTVRLAEVIAERLADALARHLGKGKS